MAYVLLFAVIFALLLAGASLYRYGNIPRQHLLVTFSVLIAWCFSFMIVFTLPLDITNVSSNQLVPPTICCYWLFQTFFIVDRLQAMPLWKHTESSGEWNFYRKNRWDVPKTMGNDLGWSSYEFVAIDLLDFTASHLVDHASNAILFESWRFHYERKVQISSGRQCYLLWILLIHLRYSLDLHCL